MSFSWEVLVSFRRPQNIGKKRPLDDRHGAPTNQSVRSPPGAPQTNTTRERRTHLLDPVRVAFRVSRYADAEVVAMVLADVFHLY